MIRIRFKELLADREFKLRRLIMMSEVEEATGIHRSTLSKIANQPGYNTGTGSIDRLCRYFDCRVEQLLEYVPEEAPRSGSKPKPAKR